MRVMKGNYVSNEDFVRVWLEAIELGEGTYWMSKQLNLATASIRHRADNLRKNGVKLPKMLLKPKTSKYKVNSGELNKIIKEKLNGN